MTDTVNTILDEVQALTALFEEQRNSLVEKIKPSLHGMFLPYLEANPQVEELHFTAYTPYFNDGEECIYRVGALYGTVEDDNEFGDNYGPDYDDVIEFVTTGKVNKRLYGYVDYYTKPSRCWRGTETPARYPSPEDAFRGEYSHLSEKSLEELEALKKSSKDFRDVRNIMGRIPDDIIKQLFGDHIKVTITREGVEVEEYDHD